MKFLPKLPRKSGTPGDTKGFGLNSFRMPFGKNTEKVLLISLGAFGLTALLLSLEFHLFEANLYDFRTTFGIQPKPDPQIVTISVDDSSVKAFDEFAPFPLDYHVRFIEWMERAKPKALGYLVDLNRVYQAGPELFQSAWSQRFVDSVNRLEQSGSSVLLGTTYDVTGEVVPPYPLSLLPHGVAVIHKDGNLFGEDRITRRALVTLYDQPSFPVMMARKLKALGDDEKPPGTYLVNELKSEYFFFRYFGPTFQRLAGDSSEKRDLPFFPRNDARGSSATLNTPKQGSSDLPYKNYSFHDVLNGSIPESEFSGKIVLVGTVQRDDSTDFALTPYSKEAFTNPKLFIHANILDSVLHKESIHRVSWLLNWVISFLVIFSVMAFVLFLTPSSSLFATVALAVIFLAVGHLLFQFNGVWIRESQPLIGIFLAYYLFVPYRLIREYRKRWDYQRKNELLIQVEDLKTHFMSLVTHDLKTPVARIQGLAETLTRSMNSTNLFTANSNSGAWEASSKSKTDTTLETQQKALTGILSAADDLNRFINSILELNKVESKRLHIQMQSKDINAILEAAAAQLEDQAKAKNIKIEIRLEPLFSIPVDPVLMAKVFINLIDNAIKYSPPHSTIRIHTTEENDRVVIAFQDEGIGLSEEELSQLFTRFYRAKNDTTAETSGTGLGLYLAKYFVEAHQGTITVESHPGEGTLFKISLPTRLKNEPQAAFNTVGLVSKLESDDSPKKEGHYV